MCGDGPVTAPTSPLLNVVSPRVWGWTPHCQDEQDVDRGFPACVGMDPRSARAPIRSMWFPRVCGDGPRTWSTVIPWRVVSPRVWGWTPAHDHKDCS